MIPISITHYYQSVDKAYRAWLVGWDGRKAIVLDEYEPTTPVGLNNWMAANNVTRVRLVRGEAE